MSMLGFVLGLVAVAATSATLAAVVGAVAVGAARRSPLSAARRADVALFAALGPAVVALVVVVLVALPALLAQRGLAADHCLQHDHHGHLCPTHLTGLSSWLAAVAAVAAAAAVLRLALRLADLGRQRALLRVAVGLGEQSILDDDTTLVTLEGPPTLLHAASSVVVASRALLTQLSPASRRAALAHEAAHVRRGDARCLSLLSLATSLAPPIFDTWIQRGFRQAAEEAADENAAAVVGVFDLAGAVVDVSRLRLRSSLDVLPAIDGGDVEGRVERLLRLNPRARRSGAAVVVGALTALSLATLPFFDDVHHLAETALAELEPAPLHHR